MYLITAWDDDVSEWKQVYGEIADTDVDTSLVEADRSKR